MTAAISFISAQKRRRILMALAPDQSQERAVDLRSRVKPREGWGSRIWPREGLISLVKPREGSGSRVWPGWLLFPHLAQGGPQVLSQAQRRLLFLSQAQRGLLFPWLLYQAPIQLWPPRTAHSAMLPLTAPSAMDSGTDTACPGQA